MESSGGVLFLVFLIVFILIIAIVIACYPRSQTTWKKGGGHHIPFNRRAVYATALRSQKDTSVIPELPILVTPTTIDFNQPDTNAVVPRSGTYTVSYTVQLKWLQEATASLKITSNDGNVQDLIGSQLQQTSSIASVESISHTFLASLKKGMILSLVCQASIADIITVPSSDDSAILFLPTTLASIALVEI